MSCVHGWWQKKKKFGEKKNNWWPFSELSDDCAGGLWVMSNEGKCECIYAYQCLGPQNVA